MGRKVKAKNLMNKKPLCTSRKAKAVEAMRKSKKRQAMVDQMLSWR